MFQFSQLEFTIGFLIQAVLKLPDEQIRVITAPYDFRMLCMASSESCRRGLCGSRHVRRFGLVSDALVVSKFLNSGSRRRPGKVCFQDTPRITLLFTSRRKHPSPTYNRAGSPGRWCSESTWEEEADNSIPYSALPEATFAALIVANQTGQRAPYADGVTASTRAFRNRSLIGSSVRQCSDPPNFRSKCRGRAHAQSGQSHWSSQRYLRQNLLPGLSRPG
jgi:hypothetical protein